MGQSRISFEDYEGFVEKFKPKRTTDDCFTPPEIYAVVLDYVRERWGVEEPDVVRPFWPGGDYEALFDYQSDQHCAKTMRLSQVIPNKFDYQSDQHCAKTA